MRHYSNRFGVARVGAIVAGAALLIVPGCGKSSTPNSGSATTGGQSSNGTTAGAPGTAGSSGGSSPIGGSAAGNSGGTASGTGGAGSSGSPGSGGSGGAALAAGGFAMGGVANDVDGSAQSPGGSSSANDAGGTLPSIAACDNAALVWKSANKTNFTSYPDPGSAECIQYNGCMWAGQFAACNGKKTQAWVAAHNIVAAFPDFDTLQLHDLCLRTGNSKIVVTVLDTCGDSDCSGCCTQNKGNADELIDIESYTNDRWGIEDGPIEWADLGPTTGPGCN